MGQPVGKAFQTGQKERVFRPDDAVALIDH